MITDIKQSIENHFKTYLSRYFIVYPGKKVPIEGQTSFMRVSILSLDQNEVKRQSLQNDIRILVDVQIFDKSDSSNVIFTMLDDLTGAFVMNPVHIYDGEGNIQTTLRIRSIGNQYVGFSGEYVQINTSIHLFNYS
jgi:hypothetical protein